MRAYLTEGELICDHETLVRLAGEVGLPEAEVARDARRRPLRRRGARRRARPRAALGINAVPSFVVDRRIGAAGAQPPEVLRALLRRGAPVS